MINVIAGPVLAGVITMDQNADLLKLAERVAELERQVALLEARLLQPRGPGPFANRFPHPVPPPIPRPEPRSFPPGRPAGPAASPQEKREGGGLEQRPAVISAMREALRRWNLWPPEGEGNLEAQAGAWWATRLGALLAVIGVVFFGLYVAHNTPPWVRLLQLAAVSLGVVGAGHWLERREGKFGAIIFGGGLALVFFTAFAAYAVPAVKTIEHPMLAVTLQGLIVAAIAAASVWKDRGAPRQWLSCVDS